jgi:2-methylcitrate dehydratase PrpD
MSTSANVKPAAPAADARTGEGATVVLAAYAASVRYDDLPPEVVRAAKRAILDTLGISIGGARTEPGRSILSFYEQFGGAGPAPVFATGRRYAILDAVFQNSALANFLDADDSLAEGHLGSTITPPTLSATALGAFSGRDVIASVVAGYEVSARIGSAIKPTPERFRDVRGLGTFQVYGAAASVGRLLGLPVETMRRAFGIAGANAPVPSVYKEGIGERPMAWVKNNFGASAQGGVHGALMARHGFRGQMTFLDGPKGFWRMAGSDRCDFAAMTAGLGERYWILENGFKAYSSCRYHHSTLDAVRALLAEHPSRPDDVEEIEVRTIWRVSEHQTVRPEDLIDAQYSLPFQIAGQVLGRAGRFDWMLTTPFDDPDLLRQGAKVRYVEDPEHERRFQTERKIGATVTLKTRSGAVRVTDDEAWGGPAKPISDADLERKFTDFAGPLLGDARAREIAAWVWSLDDAADVGAGLARLLGG